MDQMIVVPNVGEAVRDVVVTKFLKAIGDFVSRDEPIVTLETNKASLDIESPTVGVIKAFLRKEGETVPVGENLIVVSSADALGSSIKPKSRGEEALIARKEIKEKPTRNIHLSPREKKAQRDISKPSNPQKLNISLQSPHGLQTANQEIYSYQEIPEGQRALNQAMIASAKLMVSANLQILCDNTPIETYRKKQRQLNEIPVPSRLELIAWAAVQALKMYPCFRSQLTNSGQLKQYHQPSIGVAVALPEDQLTTAVVDSSCTKQFIEFTKKIRDSISLAKLAPTIPAYHSLAISDLSAYGVTGAIPIVVAPAVATLFIGMPYFSDGGKRLFQLSLSFDHRVINGAGAAKFLRAICYYLTANQLEAIL